MKLKSQTTTGKKHFDKSVLHIQKGQVKKAIKELFRVLKAEPWNIDFAHQIVSLYQRMDKRRKAIETYKINLRELDRVKNEINEEQYNKARLLIYKGILSLDPVAVEVRINVARYYIKQGRHQDAFMELFIALEHCKVMENVELINTVNKLLTAVQLNAFERELMAAEYYHRMRDRQEYEKYFRSLEQKYKSDTRKLKDIYEKHLMFCPADTRVLNMYCVLLIRLKEYREAHSLLHKSMNNFPGNVNFLELLTITTVRLKFYEEALRLFEQLKLIYSKSGQQGKYDLVVENIENMQKRIEEASFPKEMPGLELARKETKDGNDPFTRLETLYAFGMDREAMEAETVMQTQTDALKDSTTPISHDAETIQDSTMQKASQYPEKNKKAEKPSSSVQSYSDLENDSFTKMKEELLELFNSQKRDLPEEAFHKDQRTLLMDFFSKVRPMIERDAQACIDLGIACKQMGLLNVSRDLFKIAFKLEPERKKEIAYLMGQNKKLAA